MSKQRVLVTHTAPLSFQASDNWKQILAALSSQFPLQNLHWSSPSRPYRRTIMELPITLQPFDSMRDERTSQIPVTILEKPLLNIYFVACEDMDSYRSSFKKQIKEWIASVTQRKQEWLVVHVIGQDPRAPGSFLRMKGTVLDRVRADFNTDKRERCVQLAWTGGQANPAAWMDVIAKIKEGLLYAFDSAISQREEEVRRSESQRQMPGWNFCTFFILKESVASSFEGLNLLEDALLQYDELEALFFQVLKDKNLSWFGTLISPAPKDDSVPLLDVDKKPYRDLILANRISVFDFRIYLLARQCALLGRMGKVIEVATKAGAFLAAFGRRLREAEATIPEFFVESWTYSSALSVVEQCDIWATNITLEPRVLNSINASKGKLLELARNQLDTIGIQIGHLPSIPPFSLAFSTVPITFPLSPNTTRAGQHTASTKISQPDLLASTTDREKFYELYVAITNRAIDMYATGGRRRFALKLHGSLAALDFHRGRFSAALQTYTSLPAHYAPHMWTSLESLMLSRALDTHVHLDKPKDREWLHLLLSFIKAYSDSMGQELLVHGDQKEGYLKELVGDLRGTATALEEDVCYPDHPVLSIHVEGDAKIAGTQDGSFLDVIVHNRLPCAMPADEVSITLAGRDTERFRFSTQTEELASGKTPLTLFCPSSSAGTFVYDSSEVHLGRLRLQWTHAGSGRAPRKRPMLVRVPKDFSALDVKIRQPFEIELGASPKIMAIIYTGRNSISKVTLKLTSSGIRYRFEDTELDRKDVAGLQLTDDGIILSDVAQHEKVALSIPYLDPPGLHVLKINVEVEYATTSEPSTIRSLHLARMVSTSLPIAVNVQDFFRGKRLLSKFTISTTTHQHVRISSTRLEGPKEGSDGLKITGCDLRKRNVFTVTPEQSANFLFSIDASAGLVREPLRLIITCRTLREEVEALIAQVADEVVSTSTAFISQRNILVQKLIEALESDSSWVQSYGITGEVNVPNLKGDTVADEWADAMKAMKERLREHKHSESTFGQWRQIKIPVDLPRMSIVATACIRILPTTKKSLSPSLYAGQPISAILTITTSFHWSAAKGAKEKTYRMRYDVEEVVTAWLVSGHKRGNFLASEGGTYTVPITLIALHHGELPLPKVSVDVLPASGSESIMGAMAVPSTETYQVHGAEKVLVLPRGGRTTFVVGMGAAD